MAKCPSCGHPVDEEATACPNCPASWESADEAEYRNRHAPRFRRKARFESLLLVILAAGGLFAAWESAGFMMTWGASEKKSSPIVQFVDKREAAPTLPAQTPQPAPEERAQPQPEEGLVMISHERAAAARHWRFRGHVLNLETLEPVSRCAVEFTDSDTGARFETSTDGDGLYRAELPPLEGHGYAVKIHAGGYASSYLDPAMENVARMSLAERRDLAQQLQHSLDGPYTVEAAGEKPVPTDFYLAPAD